MDLRVRVDGMELDLLDGGGGGACGLGGELGGAVADALVGGIDVVEKDFLGLVTWGSDSAGRREWGEYV